MSNVERCQPSRWKPWMPPLYTLSRIGTGSRMSLPVPSCGELVTHPISPSLHMYTHKHHV